jgi:hypothetical protein
MSISSKKRAAIDAAIRGAHAIGEVWRTDLKVVEGGCEVIRLSARAAGGDPWSGKWTDTRKQIRALQVGQSAVVKSVGKSARSYLYNLAREVNMGIRTRANEGWFIVTRVW